MLDDLEFVMGDPASLRGRCIIFTENESGSDNPFNPRYPALAVASDPSELLGLLSSIAPIPEEVRDALLDKIRQSSDVWSRTMFGQSMYRFVRDMVTRGLDQINLPDELKEQVREEIESIPEEETGVPFHGSFMPLVGFDPGVIEPFQDKCDVAKVPPVPSITYGGLVLSGHAQHYLATYFLQREESAPVQETDAEEGEGDVANARDLSPQEFLKLLSKKVGELMFAKETGDPLEPHIAQLRKITRGTVFIRDVLNLSRFLETTHPKKIEIIELYLKRISLLAEERYEEIPEIDARIQALVAEGE